MSGINDVTWAEFVAVCDELHLLKRDLAIAETALEAERQWRLTSLPALLGAIAETALEAEAEVAELRALHGVTVLPRTFPELWAAVAAEYHQSTDGNRP